MRIDLYTYTFNNEDFLPFFLDHYSPIVDRIVVCDNGSTDRTLEMWEQAKKRGKPIIKIYHSGMTTWDWDEGLVIRNCIWYASDYDYIMWADPDEILFHPHLRDYIEKTNADIYQVEGWDMVTNRFPKTGTDILDIKMGTRYPLMDKYLIWKSGSGVKSVTAHSIKPTKEKIDTTKTIKLLHEKYLGVEIMVKRAQQIKDRVPPSSVCKGIGGNILQVYPSFVKTRQDYVLEIAERVSTAIQVIP